MRGEYESHTFNASAVDVPLRAKRIEFVESLYNELLGRPPENDIINHWLSQFDRGETAEDIYLAFVKCEEYQLRKSCPHLFVPPGHFYSPIVDPQHINERAALIFSPHRLLAGIALRETAQISHLSRIAKHYRKLPFSDQKQPETRYYYENPSFSYGDAIVLACTILEYRPKCLIEVGSGYSSVVALDVIERELGWNTTCAFIDPYPQLLESLIRPGDREKIEIYPQFVQDVDLGLYDRLGCNDILFIDSTHVVKTGSDVLHHLTNVLPRLEPGVLIHFHDIFYPFEYPRQWVIDENRSWNELYYLQAFLTNNRDYEIVFFNDYMAKRHPSLVRTELPLFVKNSGCSLWLRKTGLRERSYIVPSTRGCPKPS
jgi:hypothetical protein